jgi:phenylacetate-CoA ligase
MTSPAETLDNRAATAGTAPANAAQFGKGYPFLQKVAFGLRQYLVTGRKFEWKSPDEIAQYQLQRLKEVLRLAAERVPFYQRRFREAGFEPGDLKSLDDLKRLPILTKRDLREHFHELYDRHRAREAVLSQSSGTTGEPAQFLLTREQTVMELAYNWRFWLWAGYQPYARVAAFRHYTPKEGEPISRYERSSNTLYFSVHDMYESRLSEYAEAFNRFRPWLVRGYPSSVCILANYALGHKLRLHRPHAILTASETLLPQHRQTIEEALGAPVFDWYGTNERILTACQCERRGEYHMNAEAGIAEFLDLNSDPTAPGEAKSLVLTGLVNTIMPLIRYDVRDLAVPSTDRCPCGRGLPTIKQFLGRTDDILVTHEGKNITPVRFYTLFEKYPQVDQFQVVQLRPDYIEVRIVPTGNYDRDTHKRLAVDLARVAGRATLEIKRVEQVQITTLGKRRNVISHVNRR